jgi:predicted nucleotidyltransferase
VAYKLSVEEKAFLDALNSHGVRYMIVGLTSAVLQNSHVVTQDIDLWIDGLGSKEFLAAIKECGAFYVSPGLVGFNPPMLGPKSLDIFDLVTNMHGLDSFDVEYAAAVEAEISGVKVKLLPLKRVIASKEAANREKDRAVLPALKATLDLK